MQRGATNLDMIINAAGHHSDIAAEVRRLRSYAAEALRMQPIHIGEKAAIQPSFPPITLPTSGWYGWRGILIPGAIGRVIDVRFYNYWRAEFEPDTQFSINHFPAGHTHHHQPRRPVSFILPIQHLTPVPENTTSPVKLPEFCKRGCPAPPSSGIGDDPHTMTTEERP